jgi:hypothetical protein
VIDWLHDFQPDHALRQFVLDTIQVQAAEREHAGGDKERSGTRSHLGPRGSTFAR